MTLAYVSIRPPPLPWLPRQAESGTRVLRDPREAGAPAGDPVAELQRAEGMPPSLRLGTSLGREVRSIGRRRHQYSEARLDVS